MNTKKAATNRNSFSFEESARRGIVDFIFYGIQNFKFLDHSSHDGKDLTPPSPPESDGSCGPSEIGVQLGAGGPGAGLEPRQKDRLEVELTSSCDKYGHSLRDLSESFPRKWPQSRTNAPLADRFGHNPPVGRISFNCDEEAGENGSDRLRSDPYTIRDTLRKTVVRASEALG